jgi:hypothetical protein
MVSLLRRIHKKLPIRAKEMRRRNQSWLLMKYALNLLISTPQYHLPSTGEKAMIMKAGVEPLA